MLEKYLNHVLYRWDGGDGIVRVGLVLLRIVLIMILIMIIIM